MTTVGSEKESVTAIFDHKMVLGETGALLRIHKFFPSSEIEAPVEGEMPIMNPISKGTNAQITGEIPGISSICSSCSGLKNSNATARSKAKI